MYNAHTGVTAHQIPHHTFEHTTSFKACPPTWRSWQARWAWPARESTLPFGSWKSWQSFATFWSHCCINAWPWNNLKMLQAHVKLIAKKRVIGIIKRCEGGKVQHTLNLMPMTGCFPHSTELPGKIPVKSTPQ